jgi:ribonuclease J
MHSDELVRIIPLGGIGEIGKNMMVIENGETIVIVDVGIMFPREQLRGIDFIIPDFSYVIENKRKIKGILLTHGHEDHIGALPYLLKEVSAPIYGTRLTLGFAKNRLEEHAMPEDPVFHEIRPRDRIDFGGIAAEVFSVFHSVADGIGIAFHTPFGIIVHSGDFKIDYTHVYDSHFDFYKLSELGEKGVLLLMSDSTNAENEGYTPGEIALNESLHEAVSSARGKVLVATFASSTHRIQQIFDVSARTARKVAILGRSMEKNIAMAKDLGYLVFNESMVIPTESIENYDSEEVVILTTGSQGEPMSALAKIAVGKHPLLSIQEGDTVIISASVIPGNEKTVTDIVNSLYRRGAVVIYEGFKQIHASGHASQEELKLLMSITKPQFFLPIHGEFRHLINHSYLARQIGIKASNILVVENGDVVRIDNTGIVVENKIALDDVGINGRGVGSIESPLISDRHKLSESGVVIIVIPISLDDSGILQPEIFSRGFVFSEDEDALFEKARDITFKAVRNCVRDGEQSANQLKKAVRESLEQYFHKETMRSPIIVPIVIDV